jgi:hypothetical protein
MLFYSLIRNLLLDEDGVAARQIMFLRDHEEQCTR